MCVCVCGLLRDGSFSRYLPLPHVSQFPLSKVSDHTFLLPGKFSFLVGLFGFLEKEDKLTSLNQTLMEILLVFTASCFSISSFKSLLPQFSPVKNCSKS